MTIAYQRDVIGAVSGGVNVDIGSPHKSRLIVAIIAWEAEPGASFQGTMTVDGKTFNQAVVSEDAGGVGSHIEMHTIDEDILQSSSGTLNIAYSSAPSGASIHVYVFYGVESDTLYDSGTFNASTGTAVDITGIDSQDGGLVVMSIMTGSTLSFSGWTSPLVERKDTVSPPSGGEYGSAEGLETSGQTAKTYSTTMSVSNRAAAVLAVFSPAIVVTNVTSDKANGTYGVDEEIFISAEFDKPVKVYGALPLDLAVKIGGRLVRHVPNWTPEGLANCQLWLDAGDVDTITYGTGPDVNQWNDKSGNDRHVSQAVDASKPHSGLTKINGLNVITFDGTDDLLQTIANATWLNGTEYYIFAVLKSAVTSGTNYFIGCNDSGAGANNRALHVGWRDADSWTLAHYNDDADWNSLTRNTDVFVSTNHYKDPGGERRFNSASSTDQTNPTSDMTGIDTVLNIGKGTSISSGFWNGNICEVIVVTGSMTLVERERIEAYLAWKWGLETSLDNTNDFKSRPSLLWTPAGIRTQAWYDASGVHGTGLVATWKDQSGNGLDLSQSTDSLKPSTGADVINGLNVLDFDADTMYTSSNPFGSNIKDAHVFIVFKVYPTLINGTSFTLSGSSTAANRWQSHMPYGTGDIFFDAGGATGAQRLQVSGLSANEIAMLSFYNSNTDALQELWKNGTKIGSDASALSVPTVGNIFIGSDGGSTFQSMYVAEIVIINGTVSEAIRQYIEGYLAWKWGLVSSLPGAHPYATYPPMQ